MGEYAASIFWLVAFVVLLVVEGSTYALVGIWFAIGSLLAMAASMMQFDGTVQLAVFLVSSGVLLLLTRPVAKRYLATRKTRTNADRIVGKQAVVTERIDPLSGQGQVRVMGQIWSAKPADGRTAYDVGSEVFVTEIAGVKAVVAKMWAGE